jgi:hypothetical protein
MEKNIQYYIEILCYYGNKPQMEEYLKFYEITQEEVNNYLFNHSLKIAA